MSRVLKDSQGNELDIEKVRELAWGNIEASLSKRELMEAYLENLDDYDLIMWAEDENGEFPK